MSRVILAIVALLIGVAIGFFLGSGSSDGAPEVGAAARVARSSDPEAPAPLPAHAAPRIGERETPPAQAATPSPKREDAVSVAEDPENEVPSAEIRGVVRLSSGEPAERAIITCRRADARVPTTTEVIQRGDELSLPDGARVRATKSGRFAIFGLTPGMGYRLTARGDAKLDYNFVEHVEAAGVDVVAPAADVVLPLDQPTLELEFVVPPNRLQGPPQELYFDVEKFVIGSDSTTHSSGGILHTRLFVGVEPERPVHLQVHAVGLLPIDVRDLKLARGEASRKVRFEMPEWAGNEILFHVTDDRGEPVKGAGARVMIDPDEQSRASPWVEHGAGGGDENGQLRVEDVPPGPREFVLFAPAALALVPQVIAIDVPRTGNVSRDVRLTRGGHVRLRIAPEVRPPLFVALYMGSQPVEGARRRFTLTCEGCEATSDELAPDKTYEFDRGLAPGPWLLHFYGHKGEPRGDRTFVTVAGATTDLDYDGG